MVAYFYKITMFNTKHEEKCGITLTFLLTCIIEDKWILIYAAVFYFRMSCMAPHKYIL